MKIQTVEIEGFGPYKERQRIDWPANGVLAIHGENGRGKTTLFNAIRYAFTGYVKNRRHQNIDLAKMVNRHNVEEGRYGFEVKLTLEDDGNTYAITRSLQPMSESVRPESEMDYDEQLFVERNSDQIPSDQAQDAVSSLLPESISRFFFFDGELLAEYERLVDPEEKEGHRIKKEIESILGLPVLEELRGHMKLLSEKAAKQYTRLAAADSKTQQVADGLRDAQETVGRLEESIAKREGKLADVEAGIVDVEERVRKFGARGEQVGQKRAKEGHLKQAREQRERTVQRCHEILRDAWRCKLHGHASRRIMELKAEVGEGAKIGQAQRLAQELLTDGDLIGKECPVCSMQFNSATIGNVKHLAEEDVGDVTKKLAEIDTWEKMVVTQPGLAQQVIGDVHDQRLQVALLEEELKELEANLADFSEDSYDEANRNLRSMYSERETLQKAIIEERRVLKQEQDSMEMFMRALKKMTGAGAHQLVAAEAEMNHYKSLSAMIQSLIDAYRERLKENVQQAASEFFAEISNEEDFAALKINDNYGMEILHKDGTIVDMRSAGFEQVVAVSLIAALHKNAPFQGPVVMDTFLGRLDKMHSSRLLEHLPQITAQAALLVHSNEVLPEELHEHVGPALKSELEITRQRHGECAIVKRGAEP